MCRLLLIPLLCFSSDSLPEPAAPFLTRNQNPLVLIYGLPAPTAARPAPAGEWHTAGSFGAANMINVETSANEQLLIDGEIHRFDYFAEYGLNDDWTLRAQIPFLRHGGGTLDRPIERYHGALGLNQGFRPDHPRDRLLYYYRRNGRERLNFTQSQGGVGDIQVMAARRLRESAATDYSLWLGLKLPTGEADRFTGSGAADVSVWGAARHAPAERWQLYGTAGAIAVGRGDRLGDLQENAVLFGSAGAHWKMYRRLALKAQFEWHSSFYKDTDTRFLGDVLQLTFGGTWQAGANTFFDIAIAEDIKEDASPDVNFNLTLRVKH